MRALSALAGLAARGLSLEDPSQPLTGGALLSELDDPTQLWAGGDRVVDPMRIGAALRCVQILSSGVAGCPLYVRDRETNQRVVIPALAKNRVGTTPFEMWETVVGHLALWGNAFVRKIYSVDGRLIDLVPIHPARVTIKVVDGDAVGLPYVKLFVIDGRHADPLTERDVMHIPAMSLDGVQGMSVIGNMRRTFGLATEAEKLAARLYEKGFLTSGFITTEATLDGEKATILKDRWRAKLAGTDNAYEVAILDNGATWQQLTMNPVDAQFLETRQFQTTEIARIFGVPGWIINDQEKSTSWGSGMEQQFIAFVVITLKPYFNRIEQRVTREVLDPESEKAEFKVEGLLRGDSKARAAFYASGIQHGWMVPNEPRELEDLPPVPWGDEPYRPYNEPANANAGTNEGGDDDDDADA